MSGFVAVLRTDGADVEPETLARMGAALAIRGDNPTAQWLHGAAGVICQLDDGADLAAIGNSSCLVGQVRLDEQAPLRERSHATRRAANDVALLAALVQRRAEDAVPEALLGDYSVAVLHAGMSDVAMRAWRDPLGVRLLYLAQSPYGVAVSNTVAALLRLPGMTGHLDEQFIAAFLQTGLLEDRARTIYRDIRRIPPAHELLVLRNGRTSLRRYWRIPERSERTASTTDYPSRLRALLSLAIRDRLRGRDASVIMSGGLDSTALAAVAAAHASVSGHRVHAVTAHYGLVVPSDETDFARMAARAAGMKLHEVDADALGYPHAAARAARRVMPAGEPDLSTWQALIRQAAAYAPVAMLGYDGDALLQPPGIVPLINRYGPSLPLQLIRQRLASGARPYLGLRQLARRAPAPAPPWPWIASALRACAAASTTPTVTPHRTRPEMVDALTSCTWEHLFESADASFTGVSLDVCFPLLDRRLLELSIEAPPFPWLQRKHLLREAMRGVLPDAVRERPKTAFAGYFEGRLRQLVARDGSRTHLPEAWDPRMAHFLEAAAIPAELPVGDIDQSLALLRARELNDWLLGQTESASPT